MLKKEENKGLIPSEQIQKAIFVIRGERVMLDGDLASLYGLETKVLVQAVKRNIGRFPTDFMYQLTTEEYRILRSQSVTPRWGGRRYPPYAFTEQGVAMLSSVLNSPRAIHVNIEIMRAFVNFRRMASSHADLIKKIDALERKYDEQYRVIFDAIRKLMETPKKERRRIGF